MADYFEGQPAVANSVANDIVAMQQNFAELKNLLETVLIGEVGGTEPEDMVLDHAAGQDSSTFMRGTSGETDATATTAWFYENTAPPGWTATVAAAGKVLACWDDSGTYNLSEAGHTAGTWTQPNHTHSTVAHGHTYNHEHVIPFNLETNEKAYFSSATDHSGSASGTMDEEITSSDGSYGSKSYVETLGGPTDSTDNAAPETEGSATTSDWRPAAAVGKLFNLD